MCGPMGIGVLWGKSELLNQMPPSSPAAMIDLVTKPVLSWAPIPRNLRLALKTARVFTLQEKPRPHLEGLGMVLAERREAPPAI